MLKKLKRSLGYILHPRRIIYKNSYNNDVFVDFLRSKGAIIIKWVF